MHSKLVLLVIGIILMIGFSYGAWAISRQVNYSFSYRDLVKETVREMVKDEALKGDK